MFRQPDCMTSGTGDYPRRGEIHATHTAPRGDRAGAECTCQLCADTWGNDSYDRVGRARTSERAGFSAGRPAGSEQPAARDDHGHGLEHSSRRHRDVEPGHHDRSRRDPEDRQADAGRSRPAAAGRHRSEHQSADQQWRRLGFLVDWPARPRLAAHARADQWSPLHRRRSERDPGQHGRAHRSADRWCLVRIRFGCGRRCRQLHPAFGLPGRRVLAELRHLGQGRRRADGISVHVRPELGQGLDHGRHQLQQDRAGARRPSQLFEELGVAVWHRQHAAILQRRRFDFLAIRSRADTARIRGSVPGLATRASSRAFPARAARTSRPTTAATSTTARRRRRATSTTSRRST